MTENGVIAEKPARKGAAPQSVTRVIRVIEALCTSAEPLTLADLSRSLSTPKSSLAALLRGLADEGFLVSEDGAWRLGPGAFGLGSAINQARRNLQSSDLIRTGMRHLAERSGETVLFAVRDASDDQLTYVDIIESRNSVRFASSVGERRPLYATAGGRALLAADSEEDAAAYLERIRPEALTSATTIGKPALAKAIADARNRGFAQTIDQMGLGITGTAVVIRDAAGGAAGALVLAAPSARSQGRLEELAALVCAEAAAISRSLGYRPPA